MDADEAEFRQYSVRPSPLFALSFEQSGFCKDVGSQVPPITQKPSEFHCESTEVSTQYFTKLLPEPKPDPLT
ncbi:hypothetical protein L596_014212 [Steinernema carpocapsae]|uniref:Uncharacterized protein n=1 Tax=Steinernema carpocapsae TaxID=34508 RepID=A0A4U5NC78_STECR|nr:hypothetical protein L596_014212 [Steinernema carpocapsae]